MNKYPDLETLLDDLLHQEKLYKPSAFWEEASMQIVKEICDQGVHNFRSLPKPLGFFVPNYGTPASGFTDDQIKGVSNWFKINYPSATKPNLALEQFLSGYVAALSDYRVLAATDNPDRLPYLHLFSESSVGNPIEQWEFDGKKYSRSALNYLLGLSLYKKHTDYLPKTVLEIGGGFGTLGEVLLHSGIENIKYIDVDIPPTSYVAQYYLEQVAGSGKVAKYSQLRHQKNIQIDQLPEVSVLASWQLPQLQGEVDLFVNFISFQEMEPDIVENYLKHVARLNTKWILLRNMREGKQIRKSAGEVGVDVPIKTDDYLNMLQGYELVERNVVPYGYRTVDGFNSELLLLRRV